ncbi:MAG: serine/threonine-protein kinase [Planctomycetota bacterium]
MIGERLGPWRLLAKLGKGGMGAVYLAEDPQGTRAAVKVIDGSLAVEPDALRRFGNEVELLGRLEHPGVVRALGGLERDGERTYYAMEYVRGPNLAQLLGEVGRLEPARAIALGLEVLDALDATHAAGIVHRDLKSANLLLDAEGHARVCDFGLARAVDLTRLTLSGHVVGTPAYLAPEQARGEDGVPASDLYALGVVLYEALTGRLPFQADRPLVLLNMHLHQAPEPPSAHRPELSPALDAVVLRALAKAPDERYADATDMARALREVDADAPDPGQAAFLTTTIQRFIARETQALGPALGETVLVSRAAPRRRLGWVLGGVTAFAALGGGLRVALGPPPPPAEPRAAPRARVSLWGDDPALEHVEVLEIAGGTLRVRLPDGSTRAIPRGDVREIEYDERR